jgi:putative nucleotidyltransferase with HDIG domain
LAAQRESLRRCERRYLIAGRRFRSIAAQAADRPEEAARLSAELVRGCLDEILRAEDEGMIRLMSESAGERSAQHPLNVMTLSLLLGRALGMAHEELLDLGLAALLHDIGKLGLPDRVRHPDEGFLMHEHRLYQGHVGLGVEAAERMGLSRRTIDAIAQHHEMADGTGFPLKLRGDGRIQPAAKVIALVNRYDNLCNPARATVTQTPHEALSMIYSQMKTRFDPKVLGAFVRLVGVYPPGSLVRLSDERLAMVMSVNPGRPLRPRVLVYDRSRAREDALLLDLEADRDLGITRSLRPTQLPQPALHYLLPHQRVGYFFEHRSDTDEDLSEAAA